MSSFPRKVGAPSTDDFAASSSLREFDLSRSKSLRTLQVPASSIDRDLNTTSSLLKQVLSTITSPSFFEVMIIFRWYNFSGVESWQHPDKPPLHEVSRAESAAEAQRHRRRFEVLREVHKVRDFRLVLDASVWGPASEYSMRMLKEAVAKEGAKKAFCGFLSEPLVTYHPQRSRLVCDNPPRSGADLSEERCVGP